MRSVTPEEVRIFLLQHLGQKLEGNGQSKRESLSEDCDLLLSGIIDSIGLLELVGAIQEFVGVEIDFDTLDPEQMTIVGPLCKFVSEQTTRLDQTQ
jgi:acyl carrier protein